MSLMIYELRSYTLKAGATDAYLALFEERGYTLIRRYAEPVGYWRGGPLGTGPMDVVHHIWSYESVSARLDARARLYGDETWTAEVLPAFAGMVERLEGRLFRLAPACRSTLAAVQDGQARGPVVASWSASAAGGPPKAFARLEALTGRLGVTLSLRHLEGSDLQDIEACEKRDIWAPASFSRIL